MEGGRVSVAGVEKGNILACGSRFKYFWA